MCVEQQDKMMTSLTGNSSYLVQNKKMKYKINSVYASVDNNIGGTNVSKFFLFGYYIIWNCETEQSKISMFCAN